MNNERLVSSDVYFGAEQESENQLKEKILTNHAFQRFAQGFSCYQKVLQDAESGEDREIIKERMHGLYFLRAKEGASLDPRSKEIVEMADFALSESENGSLTKESLGEKLSSLSVAGDFLEEWSGEAGKEVEGMGIYVNEMVLYKKTDNSISISFGRADIEPESFKKKALEGLKRIAGLIREGKIDCNEIIMKSWLLGKKLRRSALEFLGGGMAIDESPEDEDTAAIQFNALQFNAKNLKRYLETGEKPDVGMIIMTKEEFISKF